MNFPYLARIMACLPGHEPVEFFRIKKRQLAPSDIRYWTSDIAPEWTVWVEHYTHERALISPRPIILTVTPKRLSERFTHEEKIIAKIGAFHEI